MSCHGARPPTTDTPPPEQPNKRAELIVGSMTLGLLSLATYFVRPFAMLLINVYIAYVCQHYWRWFLTPVWDVTCPRLLPLAGLIMFVRAILTPIPQRADTPEEAELRFSLPIRMVGFCLIISILWGLGFVVLKLDQQFGG